MAEAPSRVRLRTAGLDAWVLVVTVALTWPVARPGQLLARDLVLTSRPPLRPESFGLGSAAPRAVPLDAVVAMLSAVLTGEVFGRLAVVGGLLLAGAAAHRVCGGLGWPARALAGGLAVWNPFVVERLALGQWALLLAYAAVFPLVGLSRSVAGGRRSPLVLGPLLLLAALTPTGALIAGAVVVLVTARPRPRFPVVALAVTAQVPWLLPVLLGAAGGTSSADGVIAFAAREERPGGVLWTLLGWGGVWDSGSVPPSRAAVLGHLTSLVVLVALGSALVLTRRRRAGERSAVPVGLWVAGGAGLLLAWLPATPVVGEALARALPVVPGLGLLRDAQKWLLPFVVLGVLVVAEVADRSLGALRARWPAVVSSVAVVAVVLPVVLLPDGPVRVWRTLTPARTPAVVDRIAAHVDGSDGRLVTVPLRAYRRFAWAPGRLSVYDPASRWFDVPVITSDRLVVGELSVPGEDPQARAVEQAWERPDRDERLRELGIRWLVGYRDDPSFDRLRPAGWTEVVSSPDMVLWELPRAADRPDPDPRVAWTSPRTVLVLVADAVVVLLLLGGALGARTRGVPLGGTSRSSQ